MAERFEPGPRPDNMPQLPVVRAEPLASWVPLQTVSQEGRPPVNISIARLNRAAFMPTIVLGGFYDAPPTQVARPHVEPVATESISPLPPEVTDPIPTLIPDPIPAAAASDTPQPDMPVFDIVEPSPEQPTSPEKEGIKPREFTVLSFDHAAHTLTLQEEGEETSRDVRFRLPRHDNGITFSLSHQGQTVRAHQVTLDYQPFRVDTYPFAKIANEINEIVGGEPPFIQKSGERAGTAYIFPALRQEVGSVTGTLPAAASNEEVPDPSGPAQSPGTTGELNRIDTDTETWRQYARANGVSFEERANGDRVIVLSEGTELVNLPGHVEGVLRAFVQLSSANPNDEYSLDDMELTGEMPQFTSTHPNTHNESHRLIMAANSELIDRRANLAFRYTENRGKKRVLSENRYHLRKYTPEQFDQIYPPKISDTPTSDRSAGSTAHESDPRPNNIVISPRGIYELAVMVHQIKGRRIGMSPTSFPDTPALASACAQIFNNPRFREVAQLLFADAERPVARKAVLSSLERYIQNPSHLSLELGDASDLLPQLTTLIGAFQSGETETITAMRDRFGLKEQPQPVQVYPAASEGAKQVDIQAIIRTSVYAAVSHELGMHPNKPSMERVLEAIEERIDEATDQDNEGTAIRKNVNPRDVLAVFFTEVKARKQERDDNAKRVRKHELPVWDEPENEDAARDLGKFARVVTIAGPRDFEDKVREHFAKKEE